MATAWAVSTQGLGCGDAPVPLPVDTSACELVAVVSDYRSTAVSLLTGDGSPCALDVLTSGSRPPGLLTALSGDVTLPSEPASVGAIELIDRYPNAVLTRLGLDSLEVSRQARLSPGFAGNPQDLVALPPSLLVVSRLERDPATELGSDLLLLSGEDLSPRGRIDLGLLAVPGFDAMPARLAVAAGRLWVGLSHLSTDFRRAGPGRIAALSLAATAPDTPLADPETVALPGLTNCGQLAKSPDEDAIWVVCAGLFASADGARQQGSGLARISTSAALTPTADLIATAETLGRPLAFPLAPLSANAVAVVLSGDLTDQTPDRLVIARQRATGAPLEVTDLATGGPFELSGLTFLDETSLLLLADGDPRAPRLRRFDLAASPPRELAPVTVSRTGLPPRQVVRLRR